MPWDGRMCFECMISLTLLFMSYVSLWRSGLYIIVYHAWLEHEKQAQSYCTELWPCIITLVWDTDRHHASVWSQSTRGVSVPLTWFVDMQARCHDHVVMRRHSVWSRTGRLSLDSRYRAFMRRGRPSCQGLHWYTRTLSWSASHSVFVCLLVGMRCCL